MSKYPFERQQDLKDCGVCCLSMILKYYNSYIPLEKLRDMNYTSKKGMFVHSFHFNDFSCHVRL